MRIIVVSDTHGNSKKLKKVIERHLCNADLFLHLGDGIKEFRIMQALYPEQKFQAVRGNCDYVDEESIRFIECGNHIVFACHGDFFYVKKGLESLKQAARKHNASIALYGHTHKNFTDYEDGLYIMNPGSLSQPRSSRASYGIIDITNAGIAMHIVEVNRCI